MGICKVKKLMDSVNNDNLPKYGIQKTFISVNAANIGYGIAAAKTYGSTVPDGTLFKSKIVNNVGYMTIRSNQYTEVETSNWTLGFVADNNEVSIVEHDILSGKVIFGSYDLDSISGSENVYGLVGIVGTVGGKTYSVTGSLTGISEKFPNLAEVHFPNCTLTGTLNDFINCLNIGYILLNYSIGVTGSVEELAAGQVAKGRTSGIVRVYGNGVITHNGTVVTNGVSKYIKYDPKETSGYIISDTEPS